MKSMDIFNVAAIPLFSFLAVYAILYLFFSRLLPEFKKIKLRFKIAFLTGLSHFILIIFLCAVVAISIKNEPESGMIFGYYLQFYDFIFFGYAIWFHSILNPILSYNALNVVAPFIAFGILGSLTYACLGLIIGRIIEIIKQK